MHRLANLVLIIGAHPFGGPGAFGFPRGAVNGIVRGTRTDYIGKRPATI